MYKIITSADAPLYIDVVVVPGSRGQIGMTFCPGKKDHGNSGVSYDRDLDVDLDVIAGWGAEAVVTLLEGFEMEFLWITALPDRLQKRGIGWYHLPIRDVDIPDSQFEEKWLENGQQLRSILNRGGKILLHCRGGIGRTGTVAAKLLVESGFEPAAAIALVRRARRGTIETAAQEQYVLQLKKGPASPAQSTPS